MCHGIRMKRVSLVLVMMFVLGLTAPVSVASAAPVYCKLNPTFNVPQVGV